MHIVQLFLAVPAALLILGNGLGERWSDRGRGWRHRLRKRQVD